MRPWDPGKMVKGAQKPKDSSLGARPSLEEAAIEAESRGSMKWIQTWAELVIGSLRPSSWDGA